jgi:hypothetical protein
MCPAYNFWQLDNVAESLIVTDISSSSEEDENNEDAFPEEGTEQLLDS